MNMLMQKVANRDANVSDAQLQEFLRDLTALSHRHGIGITGSPTLFLLERDDFALGYGCDEKSKLTLA